MAFSQVGWEPFCPIGNKQNSLNCMLSKELFKVRVKVSRGKRIDQWEQGRKEQLPEE